MKKIGIIGTGRIANYHIEAALAAGFEIGAIYGRTNSINFKNLQIQRPDLYATDSFKELRSLNLDAISIITSSDALLDVYRQVIENFDPVILIEKPVTLNYKLLENGSIELDRSRTIVGYNRRFYSSVIELRKIVNSNELVKQSHWEIPEMSWDTKPSKTDQINSLSDNTVHIFDLMLHLNGNVKNMQVYSLPQNELYLYRSGIVEFENGNIATFSLNFGVPNNTAVSFAAPGKSIQLKPIEFLTTYDRIDMLKATKELPMKRYVPQANKSWKIDDVDLTYKPGFFLQYKELMNICNGQPRTIAANLQDALNALKLAHSIKN